MKIRKIKKTNERVKKMFTTKESEELSQGVKKITNHMKFL